MEVFDYKKRINILLSSGCDVKDIFTNLVQAAVDHYSAATHTIQHMKYRNSNQPKGAFWELFSLIHDNYW